MTSDFRKILEVEVDKRDLRKLQDLEKIRNIFIDHGKFPMVSLVDALQDEIRKGNKLNEN